MDDKAIVDNVPKKYRDYDFSGMVEDKFNRGYIKYCREDYVIRNYSNNKPSLVFCGNIGTGKTRLAIATLKNMSPIYQKNIVEFYSGYRATKSIYILSDMMFDKLNQAVKSEGKEKYFKELFSKYDIILLDELSLENFTSAKQENLYLFISYAYVEEKPIIITMNFTLDRLRQVEPRSEDRLKEMAIVMDHKGDSFRK